MPSIKFVSSNPTIINNTNEVSPGLDEYVQRTLADFWIRPYQALACSLHHSGWEIIPSASSASPDVLFLKNLSWSLSENASLVRDCKRVVIHVTESPLYVPNLWSTNYFQGTWCCLTYDKEHMPVANTEYTNLPFVSFTTDQIASPKPPWTSRKPFCVVSSCKASRIAELKASLGDVYNNVCNAPWVDGKKLIDSRSIKPRFGVYDLIAYLECCHPDAVDLYGYNWSLSRNVLPRVAFQRRIPPSIWRGSIQLRGGKIDVLSGYKFCFVWENYIGKMYYVSEKLFDCLAAGVIPVYYGDIGIHDCIPRDIFIDARSFDAVADLVDYLLAMPRDEWEFRVEAGRSFIQSTLYQSTFGRAQFVSVAGRAIARLLGSL